MPGWILIPPDAAVGNVGICHEQPVAIDRIHDKAGQYNVATCGYAYSIYMHTHIGTRTKPY